MSTNTKPDTHWHYCGDVNPQAYGGKWYRRTHDRSYQFIEIVNMNDACGRDNEGHPTYVVELSLVDLDKIPAKEQTAAWRSCGPDEDYQESDTSLHDLVAAEACHSYGCKAPLESWEGNSSVRLLRVARTAAHTLKGDSIALGTRLSRPVNKIGSTAAEYMIGDIDSALNRGIQKGDPTALLIGRIYGRI